MGGGGAPLGGRAQDQDLARAGGPGQPALGPELLQRGAGRLVTLLGGAAVPHRGLHVVAVHPAPVRVEESQAELGVDVALLSRAPVPGHRGRGIGGHALPALVHEAHHELRGGVAALGEREPLAVGGGIVGLVVRAPPVLEAGPRGAGGQQRPERDASQPRRDAGDQAIAG